MPPFALRRYVWLVTAFGVAVAQADAPKPDAPAADTSGWKCEQCPFFKGYTAEVEAGVLAANGANDSYGRYTGVDHNGAYADVGANGQWAGADGAYASYDLENLGLASRDGSIEAGQQGRYDVRVGYDGQPSHLLDTTVTPFVGGGGHLSLPQNWVASGSTGGMTQLNSNLHPIDIETNRRTVSLLGKFFATPSWTLYGEFRHQEKEGTGLTSGSFLTDAAQLAQPIDYVTNSFEAGAAWAGRVASARLAYTGSWFTDNTDSLTWSNPYLPVVPGATEGRMALPPGNNLQQLSASGEVHLPPWMATTLTYGASVGEMKQNAAFLPISTLPNSPTLPQGSLDGNVHVSHYALGMASRPLSKLYLRGNATYDGRDDRTRPLAIAYIVTDTLPGGTAVTPRYGEDRTRLDGSADYRLFTWARIGVGGDLLYTHYAPGQVLTYTHESRSWAHATFNPLPSLSLTVKGGDGRRAASSFNVAALPVNENPLIRAFDYAPRDRTFFSLSASWQVTSSLSWTLDGSYANDAYRLSQLGLRDGHDRDASTTLSWAPGEKFSLYWNGGYQRMTALQHGLSQPATPVWDVTDTQHYWNTGAGGHWALNERWDLNLDYVRSISTVGTDVTAGTLAQSFPENRTQLDSLWLKATYRWTRALRVRFRYGHEKYDTNDWALDNVGPATVPNLLSLGAQPFRHDVNAFSLTALYQIGARQAE
jgi:MtrB/PioB family decaheme-associated outer membrane protein